MTDRERRKPSIANQPANPDDYIWRPWITRKDGRRVYARDYGLTAFRIPRRY